MYQTSSISFFLRDLYHVHHILQAQFLSTRMFPWLDLPMDLKDPDVFLPTRTENLSAHEHTGLERSTGNGRRSKASAWAFRFLGGACFPVAKKTFALERLQMLETK